MLFKTYDFLVKIIGQIKEDAVINGLREVQKDIIASANEIDALRKKNSEMADREKKLEAKLLKYEKWDKIEKKYLLTELVPHVFVYAPKPGIKSEEPRHYLCTNCFKNKEESILQYSGMKASGKCYHCDKCGSEIVDYSKALDLDPVKY